MKKMTKPTSKITTPNTSPLYKLLIVSFLAVLFVACDDDKDDNKPVTYSVTFDTDGGTPEITPKTVKSGEQVQEPDKKPSKGDTVVFSHWETEDGTTYDFSQTVNANLILKAVYAKAYKVRFNTDGGNTIDDEKVLDGEPIAAPMPPTKTDEFFAGWYADAAFTAPYDFSAPVKAEFTLYARWSDYNIPDDKFRAYLKGRVPNAFNGEQLQPERQDVKELKSITVNSQGIVGLEGIQYFTGLTDLYCESNQLSSLDVSNNTALTILNCAGNQLSSLDVSTNTALTTLFCAGNQLSSLDVSTNTALTTLSCAGNQLSSLDVSTNTALIQLTCPSNQLSSLDVSANKALTTLRCSSNQLSSLNMKANTNLRTLYVSPNEKLAEILVHASKLCDAGILGGSGVNGIFEANKGSLEMTIKSYDDNGNEALVYDEAAYTAACPNE